MQAGFEKTQSFLLAMLAGANIIYGPGMLELGMTLSFGQLVADNEMIRMLRRILKGMPVTDETMAVEVIDKVGPRGHFLMEDHTLANMKNHEIPELIDREPRMIWMQNGGSTFADRAAQKAIDIIENHKPTPLPGDIASKLRAFVEDMDREFGQAG